MTDDLGKDLTTAVGNSVQLFYGEAEVDDYPFCVYNRVIREQRTKDGVVAILSELSLECVADTYAAAKTLSDTIRTAVEGLGSDYVIAYLSTEPVCVSGVWDIKLEYNIKQIS